MTIKTHSAKETKQLGQKLAPFLEAGDVVILTGDLGAGKTVFVSGLAKGLGVREIVVSSSFVIIKEYKGRLDLYHIDAYRLEEKALAELGLEEYFYGEGVSVVEWGYKVLNLLPEHYLEIKIHQVIENPNQRQLEIKPVGKRWEEIVRKWLR